jgi:hypothetical protein
MIGKVSGNAKRDGIAAVGDLAGELGPRQVVPSLE